MTPALLLLAFLSRGLDPGEAMRLTQESLAADAAYHLRPATVGSVILVETGGEWAVGTGRGDLGRDAAVGWGQVLVPRWRSGAGRRVTWWLRDLRVHVSVMGMLLADSRRRCARQRGCPCPEAHYNWGSRTQWCRALRSVQRRLRVHQEVPGA